MPFSSIEYTLATQVASDQDFEKIDESEQIEYLLEVVLPHLSQVANPVHGYQELQKEPKKFREKFAREELLPAFRKYWNTQQKIRGEQTVKGWILLIFVMILIVMLWQLRRFIFSIPFALLTLFALWPITYFSSQSPDDYPFVGMAFFTFAMLALLFAWPLYKKLW